MCSEIAGAEPIISDRTYGDWPECVHMRTIINIPALEKFS